MVLEIDLSKIRLLFDKICPGCGVEWTIVENFEYYPSESRMLRCVAKKVIDHHYGDVDNLDELYSYYRFKVINDRILHFHKMLSVLLNREIGMIFNNVKFKNRVDGYRCNFVVTIN